MQIQYILTLSLLLSCSACSKATMPSQNSRTDTVAFTHTSENRKYNLACVFHGEEMTTGSGEKVKVIRFVTLRDIATGKEAMFVPADEASLVSSQGYFANVWSPDEEYLVLPLGRFKGFCIIRSRIALESVQKQQCDDFIRVQGTTDTGLWHEFDKWSGGHTFLFQAGLSGDDFNFEYDIQKQRLTGHITSARSFIGENGKGKLNVEPQ
jgi:hypothetical protein